MKATAIKNALRFGSSADLERRRNVIALSALGLLDFSIISLYQTGFIKKLPDIPHPLFDSNKVNAANDAYAMGVPDGTVSAAVYAVTMVLASAGGSASSGRKPVLDILLGGAVAGNAAGAAYYLANMIFKQKKICIYCVTGAANNFASAAIIAPAVLKSIRRLRKK
jgi:uncharacterized membrane protein